MNHYGLPIVMVHINVECNLNVHAHFHNLNVRACTYKTKISEGKNLGKIKKLTELN